MSFDKYDIDTIVILVVCCVLYVIILYIIQNYFRKESYKGSKIIDSSIPTRKIRGSKTNPKMKFFDEYV